MINALEVIAVYKHYFPSLCQDIEVEGKGVEHEQRASGRVASFYSGGVDSLYNIVEYSRLNARFGTARLTDLWVVHGFDIKLDDSALWNETWTRLNSQITQKDRLSCVDIRTNLRNIYDTHVRWAEMGFSAALGGVAKCVGILHKCND
ncbi:MAG: hypothetical protein AAF662_08080, partial [Pseudomonadota bacterium]